MSARPVLVIAHRACALDAPENSLEGIRLAPTLHADAVEIDVRLTRDRVPILMHDASPRRTAGDRLPVRLSSSSRLRRLQLGNGEPVPTLAEALAALPAALDVAIDVKAPGAVAATVAEVVNQRLQARTLLWSRDTRAVRYAADREPAIEPGLLRDARTVSGIARFVRDARAARARAISAHWAAITPELAVSASRHGLKLYSWCQAPDPDLAKLSLLDAVVTDWPTAARAAIDSLPGDG